MNRRELLAGSAVAAGYMLSTKAFAAFGTTDTNAQFISLDLDATRRLGAIAPGFTGLGYEISSVALGNLLTSENRTYVQMVRSLGKRGVIRIGGNTSDYASFQPQGKLISTPKGTVINQDSLSKLGTFLNATGWKLIWGLNLGSGTEQSAVEEAQAVANIAKDKLLAFEIGNEPDLFVHEGHRARGYSYENYRDDYRRFKSAIRAKLLRAPFAGPDVAGATEWVARFAKDEGPDLKLLTHHYYRSGASNPISTLNTLLRSDPRLEANLAKLKTISSEANIPFRICETNSFSGGGKPGVSDTFGSALWILDYMLTVAWGGGEGVNIETGVNQLDTISSYSPIADDRHGKYSAAPDYYGMLAFAQIGQGQRLALDYNAGATNLKAYAVLQDEHKLVVALINKDASSAVDIELRSKQSFTHASAMRLTGPSLQSKQSVTFAGAFVASDGTWRPQRIETLPVRSEACRVHIPAGSAAIVVLGSRSLS